MKRIITGAAAALALSLGGLAPAGAAVHARALPFNFTTVDMTNGSSVLALDEGSGSPFFWIVNGDNGTDFNETGGPFDPLNGNTCYRSSDGRYWCHWEDGNKRCMNSNTDGGNQQDLVVANSCQPSDTAEEFNRFAVSGGWALEQLHSGLIVGVYTASCNVPPFPNCEALYLQNPGLVVNFPAS